MRDNLLNTHDPLIGIAAVIGVTSLSKATVYRLMAKGGFPQAVPLTPGGHRVAWRKSEVTKWAAAPLEWGLEKTF